MSYQRLAYDDQDTAPKMHSDCSACATEMRFPTQRIDVDAALGAAPSIEFENFPQDLPKPQINVTDATALLAARMYLHID